MAEGLLNNEQFVLLRTSVVLSRLLNELVAKDIETLRIARLGYLLLDSGIALPRERINEISSLLIARQHQDGGWADTVETIWAGAFFQLIGNSTQYEKAKGTIYASQHSNGAWGKSLRDMTRIPVTGVLSLLMPEFISERTKAWLKEEWIREWDGDSGTVSANYKAVYAMFGLGLKDKLTRDILYWLIQQSEPDGGWGPWRGHPIGSQALYTALSMRGIAFCWSLANKRARSAWYSGRDYLLSTVTPYGLWPSHHIDDGSAWAFNALLHLPPNAEV